jgi:hypothetical protein
VIRGKGKEGKREDKREGWGKVEDRIDEINMQ